jgi:hypothetical protein
MLRAKRPAYVDRILFAAAFGVVALIVVFGRPVTHSHRSGHGVTINTAGISTSPVATGVAANKVASPAN